MNIIQLKYFNAVCVYQTVSAAAEYLHIAQPSLSNAIKELEKEFGVILFIRHRHGMKLTPEGEVLYKLSQELLNNADKVENIMNDLGKERKVLRLGVPPMIGFLLLPFIYREFPKKYPEIHLEITEGGREELLSGLREDFLDMVFLPHKGVPDRDLAVMRMARLEIVCCTAMENPIAEKNLISPYDLTNTPLVLYKSSFFQTEEVKKWFAIAGVEPKVLLQTEQLSTVQSLISHNIAAGFLFRPLVEGHREMKAIPTKDPMYAEVSLVWKKDAYLFSTMKKFRDYISAEGEAVKKVFGQEFENNLTRP